jgi:hypothetical protein
MAEDRITLCDHLVQEALLYAAGELEGEALRDFEERLSDHPETQLALAQAVQLSLVLEGRPLHPDPAYRSAVRRRCVPRVKPQRYFVRVAGFALVATLLMGVSPTGPMTPDEEAAPEDETASIPADLLQVSVSNPGEDDRQGDEPIDGNDMLDMALDWAEFSGANGHLLRTWDEEVRRKARERVRIEFEPSWQGAFTPPGEPD